MIGKVATETNIENGVYEAVLKNINIYTTDAYQSEDLIPTMTFVWDLGLDDNDNELTHFDAFINVPTDSEGYPKMGGTKSKMYQRLSALSGKKFDPKNIEWELKLPEEYDSLATFLELPRWDAFSSDSEDRPVCDIVINGKSVTGAECQIQIDEAKSKSGEVRQKVTSCVPMPKKKITRKKAVSKPIKVEDAIEEDELPE